MDELILLNTTDIAREENSQTFTLPSENAKKKREKVEKEDNAIR